MTGPGEAVAWRAFLRALVDQVDAGGVEARDALLRGAGQRMAVTNPLPTSADTQALALEMNDRLAGWGWGSVTLRVSDTERVLIITHTGLPGIGGAGDPPGTWLAAVLEGLYEAWLNALPGANEGLSARRLRVTMEQTLIEYGRA